ncbi:OadG family protein [Shewanella sp. JM162201]|uniref:Probable oxaloacetate decarboxylase gamma chain n=1 Tax=Shewanella jiangmenensis TaxID=2837387 RepID=A0ABS5V0C7_9GAMM|nr:OadG family protein [Shewanella jiangmenensis]MBT1443363.1 OadG family protein [Shewanella jiangmenensis]
MTSVMQQMADALWIMVLGMVLVYLFLGMLILGLKLLASRFAPSAAPAAATGRAKAVPTQPNLDPKLVAVISAAIQQHRAREGRS